LSIIAKNRAMHVTSPLIEHYTSRGDVGLCGGDIVSPGRRGGAGVV